MMSLFSDVLLWLYRLPTVVIALTAHELLHGVTSYMLGDPTAKNAGRLTVNPLKHMDIPGMLFMLLFGFGWAKPIPVNPIYYRNKKRDMALVGLAGPLANIVLALAGMLVIRFLAPFYMMTGIRVLCDFSLVFAELNFFLGIFNLIPIPPLDGGKVLFALLPDKLYRQYLRYENVGFYILMLFVAISRVTGFSFVSWIDTIFYELFNLIL